MFLLDTQRCCADRVASLPQLMSSTGNTPGQHWGLQEGKEPLTLRPTVLMVPLLNPPAHCSSLLRRDFLLLQFQVDAETLSESLERLNSTLDPKSLAGKSNSEVLLALEVRLVLCYCCWSISWSIISIRQTKWTPTFQRELPTKFFCHTLIRYTDTCHLNTPGFFFSKIHALFNKKFAKMFAQSCSVKESEKKPNPILQYTHMISHWIMSFSHF